MQDQIKDIDRLSDMKDFSILILSNLAKVSKEEFYQDSLVHFGFVKMLENIGEAAYQISRATKAEFTALEWQKIITARHVYVHDYFKIDWTKIWVSLNTIDFVQIISETDRINTILKKRFSLE